MADDTSICPKCDYIIDTSFLAGGPPDAGPDAEPDVLPDAAPEGGNSTFVGPAPTAPPKRKPTGTVPAAGAKKKTGTAVPRAKTGGIPAQPRTAKAAPPRPRRPPPPEPEPLDEAPEPARAPEPDWRPSREPLPPSARSGPYVVKHGLEEQEEQFAEMSNFIADLSKPDRLAFFGAAAVVLLSFFPWKETVQDGDVMGLMSLGVVGTAAAALTMIAVIIRVRQSFPRLGVVLPWLVQLSASCFGVLWCLIFIRLSFNGQKVHALVGNTEVQISSPSFGAYLGTVGFLVSAAGTLLGLKEKPL